MKHVLFEIPIPYCNITVPGYGLMLMIAFILAILWAVRRAVRSGANPDVILNLGFVAIIAGVVGCRAMFVYHYWEQFAVETNTLALIWKIVDIRQGGMEYYGGLILATVSALVWLALVERVSIRWYCDIIAPSVALGLAIGRVGCFLNGCCYGGACEAPPGVSFPFGSPASHEQWNSGMAGGELPKELLYLHTAAGVPGLMAPLSRDSLRASDEKITAAQRAEDSAAETLGAARDADSKGSTAQSKRAVQQAELRYELARADLRDIRSNMKLHGLSAAEIRAVAARHSALPVHPTQLYSMVVGLLIAGFLDSVYWRRRRDGQVICLLFSIEPVSRIVLELVRVDNPQDVFGLLTISQFLALGMIAAGLLGLLVLQGLPARSPRAVRWEPPPAAAPATGT